MGTAQLGCRQTDVPSSLTPTQDLSEQGGEEAKVWPSEHRGTSEPQKGFPVPQFVSRELCSLNLLLSRAHHQFSIISELSHPEHSLFWHLSLRSAIYLLTIPTPQSIHHRSRVPAPPQNSTFWHLQARLSCSFSAPQLLVVLQSPRQRSWDGWSEAGRAEGKGCCFLQLSTSGQFKTKTFGVREGNGESGSAPCDQLESIGTALLGVDTNPEGSNSTRFVTLVHCWCFWRSLAHRDVFPTSPEQESSFPTFPRH